MAWLSSSATGAGKWSLGALRNETITSRLGMNIVRLREKQVGVEDFSRSLFLVVGDCVTKHLGAHDKRRY
jgi:hypothetical protein